jgi:sensor histidine kinase regulating citrate/malate metabolism
VVASVQEPALTALLLGKAAQAGERGIDFEVGEGARWPEGVAPARDVVTIVGNLVDNALDAVASAPGARRVRVDAHVDGGYAVLTVEDSGPGLPPGEVERAFQRGYSTKQAAGEGRRGLGLALVAQSVQRLGGELRVEGPPGARFVVRIPVGGAA